MSNLFFLQFEDKSFVLSNGRKIATIKELADNLEAIDDSTFQYHVNDERNDFSAWVGDVFGDSKLSRQLSHVKAKHEAQLVVLKHIVNETW